MVAYRWVQGDNETATRDLTDLDGAPADLDLTDRTVNFILRHYSGAKVADVEATVNGTTATADLTPDALSRTGTHTVEWRITGGADDPTTYPKNGALEASVRASVHDSDAVSAPLAESLTNVDSLAGPLTGGVTLSDIVGTNLAIGSGGTLNATDTNTQLDPGHTNPTYDADEDGVIDADVNNTNTTSDVTTTGELSVSDSQPVTAGPVGDAGELINLGSVRFSDSYLMTTSTTYTRATGPTTAAYFNFDRADLTNIGTVQIDFAGLVHNDMTGEDLTAQISQGSLAETTFVDPSFTPSSSNLGTVTNPTGTQRFDLDMKVTGGTGRLGGVTLNVWGVVA